MDPRSPPLDRRATSSAEPGVAVSADKHGREWQRSKDGPVANLFSDGRVSAPTEPLLSAADALFSLHASGGGAFQQQLSEESQEEEEEEEEYEGEEDGYETPQSVDEYSESEDEDDEEFSERGRKRMTPGSERRRYTSSFHGVSWHKSSQRWAVQIRHDGKRVHVGYYTKEWDAARAYDQVARKLRGASARTNFAADGSLNVVAPRQGVARAPRGGPMSPPLGAARGKQWRGKPSNKSLLTSAPAASPRPGKRRRGSQTGTALATALANVESDVVSRTDDSDEDFKPKSTGRGATRGRTRRAPRTPRTKNEKAVPGVISRTQQRALNMYFIDTRVQQYVQHLSRPVGIRGLSILRR